MMQVWAKILYRLRETITGGYSFLYVLTSFFFYKDVKFSLKISPLASIRNKPNVSIDSNVRINRNAVLWCRKLTIGCNVGIGAGATIFGEVRIGNDVMIAPGVSIMGGGHGIALNGIPMKNQPSTSKGGIIIGNDVWIGCNSIIVDGVQIADGTVIGAGSVVTKNTKPNGVYVGNPAKLLSVRH
jgi:acetyltransferase-like isoleucine patch superfamily enzyme